MYSYSVEIERSGKEYFAHKTGFTQKSLLKALRLAGFSKIYSAVSNLEVKALAFKGQPDPTTLTLFNLPEEE
jgi:hypothetical protein